MKKVLRCSWKPPLLCTQIRYQEDFPPITRGDLHVSQLPLDSDFDKKKSGHICFRFYQKMTLAPALWNGSPVPSVQTIMLKSHDFDEWKALWNDSIFLCKLYFLSIYSDFHRQYIHTLTGRNAFKNTIKWKIKYIKINKKARWPLP